jgi:hypothetical protein
MKNRNIVQRFILTMTMVLVLGSMSFASNSDTSSVSVTVSAINELAASGDAISLTIDSATAGQDPDAASDSSSQTLAWTTNEEGKKITVSASGALTAHTLKVVATNVSGGTAADEVTLTGSAQNLVTGISETVGSCGLTFTASATAAQGKASIVEHTITYTLTDTI